VEAGKRRASRSYFCGLSGVYASTPLPKKHSGAFVQIRCRRIKISHGRRRNGQLRKNPVLYSYADIFSAEETGHKFVRLLHSTRAGDCCGMHAGILTARMAQHTKSTRRLSHDCAHFRNMIVSLHACGGRPQDNSLSPDQYSVDKPRSSQILAERAAK